MNNVPNQPAYTDEDVELGAAAISHYDWDNGLTANAEVGRHDRGQTRAVLDALAAAGRLVPPNWHPDKEWAVTEETANNTWTSEPFYRPEHAERRRLNGQRVVHRRLIAEPWGRYPKEDH